MEFLGKSTKVEDTNAEASLYRALAIGDLPSAYIISKDIKTTKPAVSFNQGLCLYLLGEYEKALVELKRSEQGYSNCAEYDIADRRLFMKAIEAVGDSVKFLPLDSDSPQRCGRYSLIRTRWLTALCLIKLGRESEAMPIIRFLSQYNINIEK